MKFVAEAKVNNMRARRAELTDEDSSEAPPQTVGLYVYTTEALAWSSLADFQSAPRLPPVSTGGWQRRALFGVDFSRLLVRSSDNGPRRELHQGRKARLKPALHWFI